MDSIAFDSVVPPVLAYLKIETFWYSYVNIYSTQCTNFIFQWLVAAMQHIDEDKNLQTVTRLLLHLSKLRKEQQLSESIHGTAKERALKEDQVTKKNWLRTEVIVLWGLIVEYFLLTAYWNLGLASSFWTVWGLEKRECIYYIFNLRCGTPFARFCFSRAYWWSSSENI